jgi:hypothetical protein
MAAQSRIRSLSLSGVADASVICRKLPLERAFRDDETIALPCILVTPQRETMDPVAGSNVHDDVGYGVLVTLVAADNQEPTLADGLDAHLLRRQRIAQAFRNQRLPGVDTVIGCRVEPADVVHASAWMANLLVCGLLLRFTSREPRGI